MTRYATVERIDLAERSRLGNTKSKLRLRGRWLADAGFVPGSRVRVTVDAGRLIIEQASADTCADALQTADVFARLDNALKKVA